MNTNTKINTFPAIGTADQFFAATSGSITMDINREGGSVSGITLSDEKGLAVSWGRLESDNVLSSLYKLSANGEDTVNKQKFYAASIIHFRTALRQS